VDGASFQARYVGTAYPPRVGYVDVKGIGGSPWPYPVHAISGTNPELLVPPFVTGPVGYVAFLGGWPHHIRYRNIADVDNIARTINEYSRKVPVGS